MAIKMLQKQDGPQLQNHIFNLLLPIFMSYTDQGRASPKIKLPEPLVHLYSTPPPWKLHQLEYQT